MLELTAIDEQLGIICKSHEVDTLDLFGSVVGDSFGPGSDVDALVSFQGRHDLFNRYMGLLDDLRELFGREVDLVMSDSIRNPIFRDEVMAHKVSVYAA